MAAVGAADCGVSESSPHLELTCGRTHENSKKMKDQRLYIKMKKYLGQQ